MDVLDQLRRDLSNDYRILCFLLRCSSDAGVDPIERRMLMMDYWIMQAWYIVARRAALPQAQQGAGRDVEHRQLFRLFGGPARHATIPRLKPGPNRVHSFRRKWPTM